MIRIASASGYWGDWPQAPSLQLQSGPIDYLVLDYLAEVTLSILSRQRARDPQAGYATDFVEDIGRLLPEVDARGVKVITNAGGANPRACAEALLRLAREAGIEGMRIGVVSGDEITDLLRSNLFPPQNLDPADPCFTDIAPRLETGFAYIDCSPVVQALREGADIVVTGRVSDPGMYLAPIEFEFGIGPKDWNAKALGTVVGHVLECGAQASGGNFLGDWRSVPDPVRLGFPIAELESPEKAVITKHPTLGGRVDPPVVKEQLVYEIGDPRRYITPDCIADFTSIRLREVGENRVEISGVSGAPAPTHLKVACYFEEGWRVTGQVVYCWPEAASRARAAGELIRQRTESVWGQCFEEWLIECVGVDGCHGDLSIGSLEPDEVLLRVSARSQSREACDWVGRELVPMVLTGPPGATGFAAGRPRASRIVGYWPGLIPREAVSPQVEVLEV
jgi:hypothetical protein